MSQEKANANESLKPSGKGHATPSRKVAEAASRRSIVGDKSKEAKKAQKAQLAAEREAARAGMAAGDERYLGARDKGPQKKMARDVIDARWNVGELMIPLMMVVLLASSFDSQVLQLILVIVMWTFLAAVVLDAYLAGRKVVNRVAAKYGEDRVERGLRWYAAVRSTQLRAMRLPKPQLKRGTKLD